MIAVLPRFLQILVCRLAFSVCKMSAGDFICKDEHVPGGGVTDG